MTPEEIIGVLETSSPEKLRSTVADAEKTAAHNRILYYAESLDRSVDSKANRITIMEIGYPDPKNESVDTCIISVAEGYLVAMSQIKTCFSEIYRSPPELSMSVENEFALHVNSLAQAQADRVKELTSGTDDQLIKGAKLTPDDQSCYLYREASIVIEPLSRQITLAERQSWPNQVIEKLFKLEEKESIHAKCSELASKLFKTSDNEQVKYKEGIICGCDKEELLISKRRHDFRTCSCKKFFADGGDDYLRIGYTMDQVDSFFFSFSRLSIVEKN